MPRRFILLFVLAALPAFPVAKEIVQLQRDVALLQDQLRALQRSVDERFAVTQQLMNQNLDAANKLSSSLAVMQRTIQDQEKTLTAPLANTNARIDTMAQQFQALRESMEEINSRLRKLDQQLADIKNIVSTVPAAAQPSVQVPAGGQGQPAPSAPPPGQLFGNARKDYQAGNYDLAVPQLQQFLKAYPDSDQAPDAQYYIGDIFFLQADFGQAVAAFDQVLERYPDSRRAPDAQFKKGQALQKQGRRDDAAKEYRALIKKYPNTPAANQAAESLRGLGLPPRAAQPKSGKTRRK